MKKSDMVRFLLFHFLVTLIFSGGVFAYTDPGYPYQDSSCREEQGEFDPYNFRKANCTSYVAYKLNLNGVDFRSDYLGTSWSHANTWDEAARGKGISVDNFAIPGDVAYWDSAYPGDVYGHVAWVEKVYYDSNGNVTGVDITEYNWSKCSFGYRTLNVGSVDFPDGFIHVLAYNEGVKSLFYLDSYEMSSLVEYQTPQEWKLIMQKVWNFYRCKSCAGDYDVAYINSLASAIGGMGGGPGSQTIPTDQSTPALPDFITDKITVSTAYGQEAYAYGYNESLRIDAYIKNVGEANWAAFPGETEADDMYVKAYLSNGYKEDSHSEWKNVGTDQILKGNIDVGTTKHEYFDINLATINNGGPLFPGFYNFVVCADRKYDEDNGDGEIPEMHKSNNCSTEVIFEIKNAPQVNFPYVDFIISSLSIINSPMPMPAGGLYSAKLAVKNIGNIVSSSGIRSQYAINGPGTNWQWWQIADDGSDAGELTPGRDQWEDIGAAVQAPSVPGTYTLRGCADYLGQVSESNEANNCAYATFSIYALPSIFVTNPTSGDNWRSTLEKHISWQANYFPSLGNVRIEYSMNGGASWRTIDSSTANDGSRYWKMCDSTTVDSSNSYIKITSLNYPNVFGISQRFTIDHASGCR